MYRIKHHRPFAYALVAGVLAFMGICGMQRAAAETVRGLPFTRAYPLEEIGNVSRGAHLNFDAFGRLAVVQDGSYAVLNDTEWIDLVDKTGESGLGMENVVQGKDGRAYYGARGSWGTVELAPDGWLLPSPLVPPNPPKWTLITSFAEMVVTADGVYFAGWNGIVYWDWTKKQNHFFELSSVARLLRLGNRVFVSSHGRPLSFIDVEDGALHLVPGSELGGSAISAATSLDEDHTLVFVRDGRLMVFDGTSFTGWPAQSTNGLTGNVSCLLHLVDGATAVAITGKGLFLVSPEGEIVSSLTTQQYHLITGLAAQEPGVLWVATENAVEKVLYGSPLTVFGQQLGLPISWPSVFIWDNRLIVVTSGRLYETVPGPRGSPSRFEPMKSQPAAGAWAVSTSGPRMLIGNVAGVFSAEAEGRFVPVLTMRGLVRLVAVGDDLCYAIGSAEIAILRWQDGKWSEGAPRNPGIGYPIVVHAAKQSVWIELGTNRVARLSLEAGRLKLRMFEDLPWKESQWTNVGIVDDTIVLTGSAGERVFFDERTESFCEAPQLQRLLARSPHWITRITKDREGMLWAAHRQGVVTFTPKGGDYEIDSTTCDLINDQYPFIHLLPDNDVWFSAARSLYHFERPRSALAERPQRPMLVSVVDERRSTELLGRFISSHVPLQLPPDQYSLSFRFFSGSYAWRRPPEYEYRLNGREIWARLDPGSILRFPSLRDGTYRLEVRFAASQELAGLPTAFDFQILPPWHRTWQTYASCIIGLLLVVLGIVRWSNHHSRKRNLALEKLVHERTSQLETTMEKLNEETRNAATLAERNRLAGEIHDSTQQGLSGAILQLDAALKLPIVTGDVRSRLNVARNMVSFTRHELQYAVWDMESPLLEEAELGEVIRKLTALINSGTARIDVSVSGQPVSLPSGTKHHLLRIAQEATTNAVRHANAKRIVIDLEYQADAVRLTVVDDGIGFIPDEVLTKNIGHFGLRGLRGRTRKIRGELQIQSSPNKGTSVRVTAPLDSSKPASSNENACSI